MLMIAPMINTIPIILNTELPVSETLLTALKVLAPVATFVTSESVTKKAKTPTAKMIRDTTTPIMAPGSMKLYLAFRLGPPFFLIYKIYMKVYIL